MRLNACVYVSVCLSVCMYACMYVCVHYTYIYGLSNTKNVFIYIYTHIDTFCRDGPPSFEEPSSERPGFLLPAEAPRLLGQLSLPWPTKRLPKT